MRNDRKKLRKFIEKERVLWYLRRGGVYFEDVNGEKEMSIVYIDTKNYTSNDLQELFQSVGWLSANYPERLKKALDNSETVFTVWDGEKLVGLVNAIDDSELTAYVHYLCVNPEYQGQGIGKNLLQRIKEKYKNYLYIILIAENNAYSARTAHPFQRNGAPFRFRLSKAQQVY